MEEESEAELGGGGNGSFPGKICVSCLVDRVEENCPRGFIERCRSLFHSVSY